MCRADTEVGGVPSEQSHGLVTEQFIRRCSLHREFCPLATVGSKSPITCHISKDQEVTVSFRNVSCQPQLGRSRRRPGGVPVPFVLLSILPLPPGAVRSIPGGSHERICAAGSGAEHISWQSRTLGRGERRRTVKLATVAGRKTQKVYFIFSSIQKCCPAPRC